MMGCRCSRDTLLHFVRARRNSPGRRPSFFAGAKKEGKESTSQPIWLLPNLAAPPLGTGCNSPRGSNSSPCAGRERSSNGGAHPSPQEHGVAMRRRVGGTCVKRLPCIQGELFEPRGELQAWHGGVGAIAVSSLGQMGFKVLSFASFSLHQQRKGGRQPGRIPGGLSRSAREHRAKATRPNATAGHTPQRRTMGTVKTLIWLA